LSINSKPVDGLSYFNTNSFSGTLYHYDLLGRTTKIEAFENGVQINELVDKEKGHVDALSKAPADNCFDGCYVLVFTYIYEDWYRGLGNDTYVYTHSVLLNITSQWVWVSGNGGGSSIGTNYHNHYDYPHGP